MMRPLGFAFEQRLPGTQKWLLVCLADYADDWGDSIFPSLDELAYKSGLSRSTVKRTFAELLDHGIIERMAEATPVSPAFYRIAGIPPPTEPPRRDPQCPNALRRAVIFTFESRCEYCARVGTKELDPDDKVWHVDRVVPGLRGGAYNPDNVTLSCRSCNLKKKAKPAPEHVRTLAQRQREKGVQSDPCCETDQAAHSEPGGGSTSGPPSVQPELTGGCVLHPEQAIDPGIDPQTDLKAGAPPRPAPESADENIGVITKIAHESIDLCGLSDLAEVVKSRCASLRIAYDSGVVRKAIESAQWQRGHR